VVDASNLERNLYLTVQLIELEVNMVIALNMTDIAESRQYKIDVDRLSTLLSAPVVSMVASRKKGTDELLRQIIAAFAGENDRKKIKPFYGGELEEHINELAALISNDEELAQHFSPRWLAIKLLEEDREVLQKINKL
jgi:ferrous iron transport protein B